MPGEWVTINRPLVATAKARREFMIDGVPRHSQTSMAQKWGSLLNSAKPLSFKGLRENSRKRANHHQRRLMVGGKNTMSTLNILICVITNGKSIDVYYIIHRPYWEKTASRARIAGSFLPDAGPNYPNLPNCLQPCPSQAGSS